MPCVGPGSFVSLGGFDSLMRILVSGAGGDIGQSIGRILRNYYTGAKVLGCDTHKQFMASDIFHSTIVVEPAFSSLYTEDLSKHIAANAIDLFIPTSEPELRLLSSNHALEQSLPAYCLMANPLARSIGFDKLETSRHLESAGLPSPWAYSASDFLNGPPELPSIFKSRSSAGNTSVFLVESRKEARCYQELFPGFMWQEYLPCSLGEFTCGVYRCLDGSTRVLAMRRRLSSGVTAFAEVVRDQSIEELCCSIAESLDLHGSINVQLRVVEGLGPMVFEINPRFSSTVGMRHHVGFRDLIWSIEEQFLGVAASDCPGTWPNVKFARRYEEITDECRNP